MENASDDELSSVNVSVAVCGDCGARSDANDYYLAAAATAGGGGGGGVGNNGAAAQMAAQESFIPRCVQAVAAVAVAVAAAAAASAVDDDDDILQLQPAAHIWSNWRRRLHHQQHRRQDDTPFTHNILLTRGTEASRERSFGNDGWMDGWVNGGMKDSDANIGASVVVCSETLLYLLMVTSDDLGKPRRFEVSTMVYAAVAVVAVADCSRHCNARYLHLRSAVAALFSRQINTKLILDQRRLRRCRCWKAVCWLTETDDADHWQAAVALLLVCWAFVAIERQSASDDDAVDRLSSDALIVFSGIYYCCHCFLQAKLVVFVIGIITNE
uniref:Secreted protein n=1 Tax=Syphacia muris TaxID=451379 RepID=A0A158R5T9_9BILA